jgi:hypothetical protein
MISDEVSPWRMHLGLAVIVGLGLSALSLPALAGVGEREPGLSLRGAEAGGPQLQLGDEGAVPASKADAPIVLADNPWNNKKNWNNKGNKNWNKNWNNGWNNNNNWNKNYSNQNWNKNYWNKNWNKNKFYVRTWKPRPYYGQFFGGVVLGSILTAAAIGIAPPAPAPGLCWYWSDPYGYRGYWDYCAPYPSY